MDEIDLTHAVIKYNLKRLMPMRCVIQSSEDGIIYGLIEESFSMGWDKTSVNIFWSGRANSIVGEFIIDAIVDSEDNIKRLGGTIIDPLSADCPIEIDWEAWINAKTKFDRRNAPFTVKPAKPVDLINK